MIYRPQEGDARIRYVVGFSWLISLYRHGAWQEEEVYNILELEAMIEQYTFEEGRGEYDYWRKRLGEEVSNL